MDLSELPPPPPPLDEPESTVHAPVPETTGFASAPEAHQPPAPTPTEMAGEVLDDLASMSGELDDGVAAGNWELDSTFVPQEEAGPAKVEGDPFGDLGELLNTEDERSSVLKFLRRD